MITVQIASQLTAEGVDGIRWVLLEPGDAELPGAPDAEAPTEPATRGGRGLFVLKALVILAVLAAALGLARLEFGAPTLQIWLPATAPRGVPASAPPAAAPGSQPVDPAVSPAQPADPTAPPAQPASRPTLVALASAEHPR